MTTEAKPMTAFQPVPCAAAGWGDLRCAHCGHTGWRQGATPTGLTPWMCERCDRPTDGDARQGEHRATGYCPAPTARPVSRDWRTL